MSIFGQGINQLIIHRFTQIDYYFRCAFPVWRHWAVKYTPKGRWSQGIRTAIRRLAFVVLISGLVFATRRPQDATHWAQYVLDVRTSIVSVIRDSLQRVSQMLV